MGTFHKFNVVTVLLLFLFGCATTQPPETQPPETQPPPMQPLTGAFTEEKIDSEVKYGDYILVFHKTQGQMPIRFVGVDKEYLFFRDIDETQNLYSVMDGKIHLKEIDRIEGIKRSEIVKRSEIAAAPVSAGTGTSQSTQTVKTAGAFILTFIILLPLMIIAAL